MTEPIGVAEAKRHFSDLIDRVQNGEEIVVSRHGKPVMALVAPTRARGGKPSAAPVGLAAIAGALADWDDIDQFVDDIYRARSRDRDRPIPDLE